MARTALLDNEIRNIMTIDGKPVVHHARADVFVIPNRAGKVSQFIIHPEKEEEKMKKLCEMNDETFDPENDWLVETWLTAEEDLGSENLSDHGFSIVADGVKYRAGMDIRRYIPAKLLPKKEGETVILNIPCWYRNNESYEMYKKDDDGDFTLELELTANQSSYRYRNFGPFEEVVEKVCH